MVVQRLYQVLEEVKTMGFDEVRVRYRQQRRAVIGDIILNMRIGSNMHDYISKEVLKVPLKDRNSFYEDIMEDIHEIDLSRIVVLGITPEQLQLWKKAQSQ